MCGKDPSGGAGWGQAHLKRNTRAHLHGKKNFLFEI